MTDFVRDFLYNCGHRRGRRRRGGRGRGRVREGPSGSLALHHVARGRRTWSACRVLPRHLRAPRASPSP
jgi:hypothetical protein